MSGNVDTYTAALLRERAALVTHGLAARVKDVDAELARIGYVAESSAAAEAPKPVKRTTTRKA